MSESGEPPIRRTGTWPDPSRAAAGLPFLDQAAQYCVYLATAELCRLAKPILEQWEHT